MRKVQGDNENEQDSDNNQDSPDPAGRSPLTTDSPVQNEPPTLSEIQERARYEAERLKSAQDISLPGNWRRHQYLGKNRMVYFPVIQNVQNLKGLYSPVCACTSLSWWLPTQLILGN